MNSIRCLKTLLRPRSQGLCFSAVLPLGSTWKRTQEETQCSLAQSLAGWMGGHPNCPQLRVTFRESLSLSRPQNESAYPRRCLKGILGPRPSWAILKGPWGGFLSLGAELPVRTAAVWLQSASCGSKGLQSGAGRPGVPAGGLESLSPLSCGRPRCSSPSPLTQHTSGEQRRG